MSQTVQHPAHLDASELGTREYWDTYYQNDLDIDEEDEVADPSELESWFDDVDAPAKVLAYLTSKSFPLSPENPTRRKEKPSVLDLGTGNGSMLFQLRLEGQYGGPMFGVDYSLQSVELARKLWTRYLQQAEDTPKINEMRFEKVDLIHDNLTDQSWWPAHKFDLVLDKGTFDAISLSSETIVQAGVSKRICELYPRKVADMIASGGYLVITSCNWTEEEVTKWFLEGEGVQGQLELYGKVQYPVFEFGGQKGQGVATVCFRRTNQ